MTNDQQTDEILPIDEKLTRDTFAELWNGIDHLKISLLTAASHSAKIGLPDEQTTKRITTAIVDLIAATAETTRKLQRHQARRKAATTAKPTGSAKPHQNAPHRTKPHLRLGTPTTHQFPSKQEPDANAQHVDDPPSTDNLHKLDRQLDTHRT